MKIKQLFNKILSIFVLLLDMVISILLFICWLPIFFLFSRKPKVVEKRIIFIVPGAAMDDIFRKFQTFNPYLQDNPKKFFEHCYRIHFAAKNNAWYDFWDDITLIEKKVPLRNTKFRLGLLYVTKLIISTSVLCRKKKVSIIQAKDPYYCGMTAFMVSKITGVPYCISLHSDYDQRYKLDKEKGSTTIFGSRKLAKIIERYVLKESKRIFPIRHSLGVYAELNGAIPSNIRIIPHGVDIRKYEEKHEIGTFLTKYNLYDCADKKIVSFIGRISRENYIYEILEAAEKLKDIKENLIFIIAGEGVEYKNVKQYVENRDLLDFVKVLGFISNDEVVPLRQNSMLNLCLMGGFSLIEACAAGKPVISYNVEWHYEMVINNQTGFLVSEHDIDAIVDAIKQVYSDNDLEESMGNNAKALAFEKYSLERAEAIKVDCYKELLDLNENNRL